MRQLSTEERAAILRCLVEGNSIRATVRITGAAKRTVTRLLREVGHACHLYQDRVLRNLKCERIQVDEIWSFVHGKDKNLTAEQKAEGLGSARFGHGQLSTRIRSSSRRGSSAVVTPAALTNS